MGSVPNLLGGKDPAAGSVERGYRAMAAKIVGQLLDDVSRRPEKYGDEAAEVASEREWIGSLCEAAGIDAGMVTAKLLGAAVKGGADGSRTAVQEAVQGR